MHKYFVSLALGLLFATGLHALESDAPLVVELSDPRVRITIPGMAGIEMGVHPKNKETPVFRLNGTAGETRVSIVTPKIDKPVSPMACADATARIIVAQTPASRDQLFLGRADDQTFLIIYGLPWERSVLLNTHIVSAVDTTQCIEAHISKISTSDSDIVPWFNGFGDSKIEAF